jgi:hypothetical protein
MSHSKPQSTGTTFKERVEIVQALVTIGAVFVGGFWTYDVFIKERREHPPANIEQKITHLALSKDQNLLRVELEVTNAGSSLMAIRQWVVRVQQILPAADCEKDIACAPAQLKEAAAHVERTSDRFAWPLIAERDGTLDSAAPIEPGEKQSFDFEFVTPMSVKAVRIYSYLGNDHEAQDHNNIGWIASSYYDFSAVEDRSKK